MCLAGMCQVVVFSLVKVHSLFINFILITFSLYICLFVFHILRPWNVVCNLKFDSYGFSPFFSFIIFIISFFPIHQYLEVGDHFTSLSQQNANQYENLWAWDHLITSVHFLNVFWNSMYELFFLTATSCTMISLFL